MVSYWSVMDSPLGAVSTATDEEHRVLYVGFEADGAAPKVTGWLRACGLQPVHSGERTAGVTTQLREYFEGRRSAFNLPVAMQGPPLHLRVWRLLQTIPFGQTRSYGWLATQLGDSTLARAVGQANSMNPIAIVVPCHRVIGSSGSLTGYAAGLPIKRWLLDFERQDTLF